MVLAACTRWSADADRDPAGYARALLAAGDTARAIERLETTDLSAPGDPRMYITLARLYRSDGTIVGRLQAQRLLERALQLYPDDPRVLSALGRTYYEQTFYPDAVRCFRAALERDPSLCAAYRYLGLYHYEKWKRVNHYLDDLDSARVYFARTLACDPGDENAALRYAYSLYALDRPDSAREACERLLDRAPGRPEPWLLHGALAYDDGDIDGARGDFDEGLSRLDPDTRADYENISRYLSAADRDRLAASPARRRDTYTRSYWVDLDPDPTTAINERRLEHVYRMFLADLFYSCAHPPLRGWNTERGEALVKFGWPDVIEATLGSGSRDGWRETWGYWIDGEYVEFLFVDEFLNGNLRIPYRSDYMLSALRYAPPETDVDPDFTPVPGVMNVTAFKNSDMSAALLVAMAIDADSVAAIARLDTVNTFRLRGALFDSAWNPELAFADTMWTSEVPVRRDGTTTVYDVVRTVPVPFDDYQVACTFSDTPGAAAAVLRSHGDAHRFAGDHLALSDLLLERDTGAGATVRRGGHDLSPNPSRRYRGDEALRVYFEIYNLRVTGGECDYTVTFSIHEAPESAPPAWRRWGGTLARLVGFDGPPVISQTFRRTGTGHRQNEEMAIDINTLDEGRYELSVTVTDRISGEETQQREAFFRQRDGVVAGTDD